MNVLTGVIILLLSMLIVGFLQLRPSVLMIFLHRASAKYSKKKVLNLAIFYCLGSIAMLFVIYASLMFIISAISTVIQDRNFAALIYILAGIIGAIGLLFPFFYFQKGQTTKLFISRKVANTITRDAESVRKHSDAFLLGVMSSIPELFFAAPLYLLLVMVIVNSGLTIVNSIVGLLFLMIAAIIPLIIMYILFLYHHNIAIIQRARVKNKIFVSVIISILYIVLAAIVIVRTAYA